MQKNKIISAALILFLVVGLCLTTYAGTASAEPEEAGAQEEQMINSADDSSVMEEESADGESVPGESPEGESQGDTASEGESGEGESAGSGMPDTALGGSATSRPPDNSTKAVDILGTRAAVYLEYDEDGYTVSNNLTPAYQAEGTGLSTPVAGQENVYGGLYIQCNTIDWDEENAVGNSGLIINARTDTETTFVLGGKEAAYDAPNGKKYNSVIVMNMDENEEYDTSATETAAGCAIAFNGKSLLLDNVYVESNGKGRPSIHIPASTRDKNVTQLSDLICVDSYVVNHSTRALLLMGGNVWFLNSSAITDSWGALSYDNTATTMYVVNSLSENTGNGYSIYDAAGCTAYVYGSRVISGGTGITVCRDAELTADRLEAADETAILPYCGAADLLTASATKDGRTVIVGYEYPIKIHADMSGPDSVAAAYLNNAYLSSMEEDVVLHDGSGYVPTESAGGSVGSSAMNALVKDYESGEIVSIACHNGKVVFDNCELKSRNGILVHSFFAYDPMASGIYPIDGAEYTGDEVVFRNMGAEGDILHEDYMRKMIVTLENAELTGEVMGTTLTGWNNYWKDQIEQIGGDEEDATLVIRDESYETLWGIRMNMDADSVWNVTGTSQLYNFTMEEGAQVQAAEGKTITIYVDCPMGNDLENYDYEAGTQIDAFEPGVLYEGVVILAE